MITDKAFKTSSIDTSTYGLGKSLGLTHEALYTMSHATVWWTLDMDEREWGIKFVNINIQKVVVEIQWSTNVEDLEGQDIQTLIAATQADFTGDTAEGTIVISTDEQWKGKTWEVINEMDIEDAIYPADCEIDFSNNTITIN